MWKRENNSLLLNDEIVLENADDIKSIEECGNGVLLYTASCIKATEKNYRLGRIAGFESMMCIYRKGPIFLSVAFGDSTDAVEPETLCLLVQKKNGNVLLMLPVYDELSRGALQSENGELLLNGYTGSERIKADSGRLLYMAEGKNPYDMMELAAKDLQKLLKSFGLRSEKNNPKLLDQLGWCTWNAFYFNVDEEKYFLGLKEFKEQGVKLGMTLIDDGWLSTDDVMPIGARTLLSFKENRKKFKSGFAAVSERAEKEYGINNFMVWHASMGYWAGAQIDDLCAAEKTAITYPKVIEDTAENMNKQFLHRPVRPEKAEEFYQEFHGYLASTGVDGVKIDVQYLIEGVEEYAGGRIRSFDIYHKAKERSVHKYFNDNVINCMSCSNDMVYRMKHTNLMRTGADYSEHHGNFGQIVSNAYSSFWLYPFCFTDWDMFLSNREDSYVEAIARIAGGSPVYISDTLGTHGVGLLQALSVDGNVLRAEEPGRPARDCLLKDPLKKGNTLKLFNRNRSAYILGLFNFRSEAEECVYSPKDNELLSGEEFIIFGYFERSVKRVDYACKIGKILEPNSAELITISPIINGAAVIGMKDKINSSAAVSSFECVGKNISVQVLFKGEYELYAEHKPERLNVNGKPVDFSYKDNIVEFVY